MPVLSWLSSATSPSSIALARRIQRRRASNSILLGSAVPTKSVQGWLRVVGLDALEVVAGPELALAQLALELQDLARFFGVQVHSESAPPHFCGVAEHRVFSRGLTHDPVLPDSLAHWLIWRVHKAFPEHIARVGANGWTPELAAFAIDQARLD
jgi:hypothetical protein